MAERIIDLPTEKMATDLRFWLRESIVRCRDCKRFSLDNSDHDYRSGWWCHRWNTDMVKPDGFCAWGKRRESA